MTEQRIQRRLAAILAADVVGYSRLMAADEEATLCALKAHRRIIDGLVASFGGRVFGSAGDSVIAEFASAVDAVRCATEVQEKLEEANSDLPEHRGMQFRVGINLGDVMVEGDDCQRRRQNRPRGGAKVGHLTAVAALLGAMGRALSI